MRVFVRGFRLLHETEGIGTLVPGTIGPELRPDLPTVPSRGEASCVWRAEVREHEEEQSPGSCPQEDRLKDSKPQLGPNLEAGESRG